MLSRGSSETRGTRRRVTQEWLAATKFGCWVGYRVASIPKRVACILQRREVSNEGLEGSEGSDAPRLKSLGAGLGATSCLGYARALAIGGRYRALGMYFGTSRGRWRAALGATAKRDTQRGVETELGRQDEAVRRG